MFGTVCRVRNNLFSNTRKPTTDNHILIIFAKSNSGMQFKHPELLWALFLLLIPILIHLFQLRKFKKTPFTNVKFLQKVVSESRKSNTLKKWLLLLTRMALLAALIIAFAQPFFAEKSALKEKEVVIYLDNSFSMQAKTESGTLLSDVVQELLKNIPEDNTFSLFTNTKVFRNTSLKSVQNELLLLPHTSKQLQLDEIYLKANTLFKANENTVKNLVVVSDFQQRMVSTVSDSFPNIQKNLIRVTRPELENVSIDSVYMTNSKSENIEVTTLFSSNYGLESIPVSLFNGDQLIAKTSASFGENNKGEVTFSLPKDEVIEGKIQISDAGLAYDNELYFNIDAKEKIKVLAIGNAPSDYLNRIYTEDEFQFTSFTLKNLNYGTLDEQNLIILNELETLPNALVTSLASFIRKEGHLLVIPSMASDYDSYNRLLSNSYSTNFTQRVNLERNITDISFSHPIYRNVFEKNVANFQYPKVSQYYRVKTRAPSILSLQDKDPFLFGDSGFFVFTSSISRGNSNFKNSPLIVPTFYNIGVNSLKLPKLYYVLENESRVDIPLKLTKDNILKARKGEYEFIPQQESFANKVSLSFFENPSEHGIYSLMNNETPIRNLSFNHSREESQLVYSDLTNLTAAYKNESIATFFDRMQKDSSINELWKWFVILALLFMGIEVLIQKYLK